MKVILLQNVDRLGKIGDVVNVKEGFARNFLIPQKKASVATEGNVKLLEALKKKKAVEEKKILDSAKVLAEKIAGMSLTMPAQAGEEEKLFGSISGDMIAKSLADEGVKIDKKDIVIDEPIKKLGVFQVTVKLHPEVKASLRVWVVKQESEEKSA
ncbi:MAG TPA: 50S ribosomal protein L9 [Candidatus Omnitrophota bacterium]|nr:50S ribosomal protein L9 [Candidatus Omnitrophota bacterium]